MHDAFICDAIRTPIGRYGGALSGVRTDDLAALPIKALLRRNPSVDWSQVDDVLYGCANQAGEDNRNVARMAALLSGLPEGVSGATINRLCGSGLDAVGLAGKAIRAGEADLVIAGGVESMSRAPYVLSKAENPFARDVQLFDDDRVQVVQDEHPRDTSLEALAKLGTPFRAGGTVTAGNASGVNDGACALVLASERAAIKHGLKPRARILGTAVAGLAPSIMGFGPAPATRKLLQRLGLSLRQFDIIELNEAFASQALAVMRDLGLSDEAERVNPNGGAIALGHPLGMSGARLVTTAMIELEQRHAQRALCAMCIGVGQGIALALERV
jgi:acetyl-CoA acetyltransferase